MQTAKGQRRSSYAGRNHYGLPVDQIIVPPAARNVDAALRPENDPIIRQALNPSELAELQRLKEIANKASTKRHQRHLQVEGDRKVAQEIRMKEQEAALRGTRKGRRANQDPLRGWMEAYHPEEQQKKQHTVFNANAVEITHKAEDEWLMDSLYSDAVDVSTDDQEFGQYANKVTDALREMYTQDVSVEYEAQKEQSTQQDLSEPIQPASDPSTTSTASTDHQSKAKTMQDSEVLTPKEKVVSVTAQSLSLPTDTPPKRKRTGQRPSPDALLGKEGGSPFFANSVGKAR